MITRISRIITGNREIVKVAGVKVKISAIREKVEISEVKEILVKVAVKV